MPINNDDPYKMNKIILFLSIGVANSSIVIHSHPHTHTKVSHYLIISSTSIVTIYIYIVNVRMESVDCSQPILQIVAINFGLLLIHCALAIKSQVSIILSHIVQEEEERKRGDQTTFPAEWLYRKYIKWSMDKWMRSLDDFFGRQTLLVIPIERRRLKYHQIKHNIGKKSRKNIKVSN